MIRRMCKMPAAAALVWAVTMEQPALACEVCYGAAESPVLDGMNLSIIFMLATVYLTIGGMLATFLIARRRGKVADRGENA